MTSRDARSAVPIAVATVFGDLRRDWLRWSTMERLGATALSGVWVLGIAAVVAVDAHLL